VVYALGRSSSSFDVSEVRVSGTHLVPAKKTLRLLQRAYVGDNLFTVTSADVRATLKPLAFVRSVTVDRDFPGTLAVAVAEYTPAAYALAGSRWYVVDESGYVICAATDLQDQLRGAAKPAEPQTASAGSSATAETMTTEPGSTTGGLTARLVAGPPGAVLPLPRIAVSGRAREGSPVGGGATLEMLQVITALPNSYRRRLAAVEDDGGQITLRFSGGPVATWGDAQRTLAKSVALRTVLAEYEKAGKTCAQIDVSIPDRTLAKPVLK
jgi:cell division septal protein FtsQ